MRATNLTLAVSAALMVAGCGEADKITAPGTETTLLAVTPSPGAIGVNPAEAITVRFSHSMGIDMEQYVDLHQGDIRGPIVGMTSHWSADRTTLTCIPDAPLHLRTRYTIHVGQGMTDANGRHVEVEEHGRRMGGYPINDDMMNGSHGGHDGMGPGWGHPGDGPLGMGFPFETRN